MRDPATWKSLAISYRIRAIGLGFAFGVFSYIFGQWLFIVETRVAARIEGQLTITALVYEAAVNHPATFYSWVAAVTCFSMYLGYMLLNQGRMGDRLERLALKDDLTMLYNRRYFVEQLAVALKRATRRQRPLSLLLLDLDHFKELNDSQGHLAGDRVLQLAAQILVSTTRLSDTVARYGGEEFTIICEDTSAEQGAVVAERVRKAIEEQCPVTISVGVCEWNPGEPEDQKGLIDAADRAMYRAKEQGRNRVQIARSVPTTAEVAAVAERGESPGFSAA